MREPRHFPQWLKSKRRELEQLQIEAARDCDVSRFTWAAWESGKGTPVHVKDILAIAKWAGKNPDDVFQLVRVFHAKQGK